MQTAAGSLFHRHFWSRLPRNARRTALFGATTLIAPHPTPGCRPVPPVTVAGGLRAASGLGASARLCREALATADMEVAGFDLTAGLMQRADASFSLPDRAAPRGPGSLIVHVNAPVFPLAMWKLGRAFVRDKYIVGYWAWELPSMPDDWRYGLPFVHEIWVPSEFTRDAMLSLAPDRIVRVVPHPIAAPPGTPVRPPAPRDHRFTVLTMFDMASSLARKNPVAAIGAFRKAFGDNPAMRLIVKVSHAQVYTEGMAQIVSAIGDARTIDIIDTVLSDTEIAELYRISDAYISLHRSEGFGLTIAEAMREGLPVVATNWSGNVDFLNETNGIPVPYRLTPALDPQGTYHHPEMAWADADVEFAADALRRLHREPRLRAELGGRAAAYIAEAFCPDAYAATVRRHLGFPERRLLTP